MLNLNQSYLSESETNKIKTWLSMPEAELFKRAIASEIAQAQVEGANFYTSKQRNDLNVQRSEERFKYADDLQCILDKMAECLEEKYQFINVNINP